MNPHIDIEKHPCFNKDARHKSARVHLPVAPGCNIQCKFCNRKFDCVNETRPGVTSGTLTPYQAIVYLSHVMEELKNVSVFGIAGPGDPFANPVETMETLRYVRSTYPEIILCLASNGLNILPYIDELKELNISHVTITVNALETDIAEKIYSWVRYGKKVLRPKEGVKILLSNQMQAIRKLKEKDIVVKVNSIVIPGVNDFHIADIAEEMSKLGVDIFNTMPYYPNKGSEFADIEQPSKKLIKNIRDEAGKHIPQMMHCSRCRADAVGLIGEKTNSNLMEKLKVCESMPDQPDNVFNTESKKEHQYIAVATLEGVLINLHLGEAHSFNIYEYMEGKSELIDCRDAPEPGNEKRWDELSKILHDCHTLVVSDSGLKPEKVLNENNINVLRVEGLIEDTLTNIFEGRSIQHLVKREIKQCGMMGNGGGCM
ncbi:MAG: radical SAM protein [Desulfobacterales bacterium]|nr:radical SAM protein [Desulfobacterales bacterium]